MREYSIDPAWALETIKRYRTLRGLLKNYGHDFFLEVKGEDTRREFARKLNAAETYISGIKKGKPAMPIPFCRKLCELVLEEYK